MLYKRKWIGWLMFAPTIFFLVVFLFVPFISNLIDSFKVQGPVVDGVVTTVAGFGNYGLLFGAQEGTIYGHFWQVLLNTLVLVVATILFEVGFALILALLVDRIKHGKTFFRIVFFLPIVISATAIASMFFRFYNPRTIDWAGIFGWKPGLRPLNTGNHFTTLLFVIFPVVWQYVGFYFVILLTGLAGISEDLMEAASIDGANVWQVTFKIKLPMLWNVLRTCMVLAITGALKVFDMPDVMIKNGGTGKNFFFLGTYIDYFKNNIGIRAALAVIIVVLGVGLSALSNLALRENKDI